MLIIIAIFITIIFLIYRELRVPCHLKHIPSVPLYKSIYSILNPSTYEERRKYLYADKLEKYGVVRQFISSKWVVVLGTPEIAKRIYLEPDTFPKVLVTKIFPDSLISQFMGENLVQSNGDQWKKYRKAVNKAFKKQFDPDIFVNVVHELMQVIDTRAGEGIDMSCYLRRLTMEVLALGLMDLKMNAISSQYSPFNYHYNHIIKKLNMPLSTIFKFLDHPKNPAYASAYRSLANLDSFFDTILKKKRKQLGLGNMEKKDILSLMIQEMDENDQFTDKELRDNIMIFVVAGHDTAAFALSIAMYFLCKHPNIQEKARQEVLSVFGHPGDDKRVPITNIQLKQIPFIDAIIKESMRFYPSIARLPIRTNMRQFEVNGIPIPENSLLALDTFHIQRSSKYWSNPDTFDPYRFYGPSTHPPSHPFAWSSFGGGQRMCIGMNFSMMEQQITLALLLLNYEFELSDPGFDMPLAKSLNILLSSDNILVNFKPIAY